MSSRSLLEETRLSLAGLSRRERVHISTAWRWVLRGCRGHKLESFAIGGNRYTTDEAFARFIAATNGQTPIAPAASAKARQSRIEAAERELSAAGI